MIIKKLETYIVIMKPKNPSNVFEELKEELQLKYGFDNSKIIEMKKLTIDDPILGNKDYFLQYPDYVPIQITILRLV